MALQRCSFVYSIICGFVYLTIPIKCLLLSVSVTGEDRRRIKTKTQNTVYKAHTGTAQPEIETRTKMKMHNVKNIKSHHIITTCFERTIPESTSTHKYAQTKQCEATKPGAAVPLPPIIPCSIHRTFESSIQCIAECA